MHDMMHDLYISDVESRDIYIVCLLCSSRYIYIFLFDFLYGICTVVLLLHFLICYFLQYELACLMRMDTSPSTMLALFSFLTLYHKLACLMRMDTLPSTMLAWYHESRVQMYVCFISSLVGMFCRYTYLVCMLYLFLFLACLC